MKVDTSRGPSGIESHQYLTGLTYEALRRAQRRARATGGAKRNSKDRAEE